MKVTVTPFARQQILQTAFFIQQEFGKSYRNRFMQQVREARFLLADNPYLGPVEPLLSDLPKTYRSIVVARLNQMVYIIDDNCIRIVAFWDCRQEPTALSAQIK